MTREPTSGEVRVFEAGDVALGSGETLRDARLVYAVHGRLDPDGANAVLLPTFYGGTHVENEYLIGPGRALDPERWCVIVPNMFGNGISSSPSTTESDFPLVTIADNVGVQHRLLREELGVESLALVIGFSMGGQQAYEWGRRFPEMVRRLAVLCSAARTAPHTWVFLEGVKAALLAGEARPVAGPGATPGKRALGRVWAGWGLSQAWYRERRWEREGFSDLEAFLAESWERDFETWDGRDLLSMIETWQAHDVAGPDAGQAEYEAAMRAIAAPTLVMPASTDLYFPPEDSAAEVALLPRGRLAVIESVFGHAAGGGADPADLAFMEREIASLLAEPADR